MRTRPTRHPVGSRRGRGAFRAFTLVELLVVIGLIGLMVSLISPSLWRVQVLMRRTGCANNLKEIARAIETYAMAAEWHRGSGTMPYAMPSIADRPGASAPNSWDTFTNWGDMQKGNPGCLWLLVSGRYPNYTSTPYEAKASWISPRSFLCPEASASRGFKSAKLEDKQFLPDTTRPGAFTCSYSYYSMVPGADPNEPLVITPTTVSLPSSTVILADLNPRCTLNQTIIGTNKKENSKNHRGEGQNMVRLDSSLPKDWPSSPDALGDDIYASDPNSTAMKATLEPKGQRASLTDSFLIP